MAMWLESILQELKGVSEAQEGFAEPHTDTGPKDHVVGVADSDLRKIFFLVKQYKKRTLELVAELMVCRSSEVENKTKEAKRYNTQGNVLMDVFWVSCRAAFPELWDKPSIGIRKGWKVVWSDHEERSLGILGAIIEGGGLEELFRDASSAPRDKNKMN